LRFSINYGNAHPKVVLMGPGALKVVENKEMTNYRKIEDMVLDEDSEGVLGKEKKNSYKNLHTRLIQESLDKRPLDEDTQEVTREVSEVHKSEVGDPNVPAKYKTCLKQEIVKRFHRKTKLPDVTALIPREKEGSETAEGVEKTEKKGSYILSGEDLAPKQSERKYMALSETEPELINPALWERFLSIYEKTGHLSQACIESHISFKAYYRRYLEDEEFREKIAVVLEMQVELAEEELRMRAFLGTGNCPKSDQLLMFYLKAHKPDVYGDRRQVNHISKDGSMSPSKSIDVQVIRTQEEMKEMQKLLEKVVQARENRTSTTKH
jgi:hypothetical protein